MSINIVELIAASLTTFAFLPQAIKTWKTKSTRDLSPTMFSILCIGALLWLTYGILTYNIPLILTNGISICLAGTILFFIFKNKKSKSIHHIGLWVRDLEEMKNFYKETFQTTVSEKYENHKKKFSSYFVCFSSGASLELMNQPGIEPISNSNHIAISVGSKATVDKYINGFQKTDIKIIGMPRTTGDGYYEAIIEDIEGNLIEITI